MLCGKKLWLASQVYRTPPRSEVTSEAESVKCSKLASGGYCGLVESISCLHDGVIISVSSKQSNIKNCSN